MLAHSGSYVQLWTITNQASYYRFKNINNKVNSLTFTADGQKLCFGGDSEFLNVIDLYTGQTLVLESASPSINIVRCNPISDLFVVGSKTGPITLINSKNQKSVFRGHKFAITATTFTSNNRTLVSGDKHGSISVLADLKKPSKLPNWSSKNGPIFDINISKQTNLMAIACGEQLALYDLNETKVIKTLDFGSCRQIKFSPYTDSLIAIATQVGDLYFFDPNSNVIVNQISFDNSITAMDFRFDGCTLALGVEDNGLNLIDIRKIQTEINCIELYSDTKEQINSIAFQPMEVKTPLFSKITEDMVSIQQISGKKTIKRDDSLSKQSIIQDSISHSEIQNSSFTSLDEKNYSNIGSILNSSSFDDKSFDSSNIEIKDLPKDQEQISLVKVAKEINRPKQIYNIAQELSFGLESPKPIKNINNQANMQNKFEYILNNFFSEAMNDMKDELHEHANKFHIDIIQKIHEIDNSLTMIHEQTS